MAPRLGLPRGVVNYVGIAVVLLFLLGWTGAVVSIAVRNLAADRPPSQVLIPMGMACAGLCVIAYIVYGEPRGRARTAYGLTDQRVMIISGQFQRSIESLPLSTIGTVRRKHHRDGSGTIMFLDYPRMCGEDRCYPELARIDDTDRVYDMIQASLPDWGSIRC